MVVLNGVKIPSQKGSVYFGILCALATYKHQFCPWWRITELCEKFMCQYNGEKQWQKFVNKTDVKSCQKRIKENTYTFTRKGNNCYGFRLHELGMGVYFFRDGAMLLTDGEFVQTENDYDVRFPDGRTLQYKYNGSNFTSREYKDLVKAGLITRSCRIPDMDKLAQYRLTTPDKLDNLEVSDISAQNIMLKVVLHETYNQDTAIRFENLEFEIDGVNGNELTGRLPAINIKKLRSDSDVVSVQVSEY